MSFNLEPSMEIQTEPLSPSYTGIHFDKEPKVSLENELDEQQEENSNAKRDPDQLMVNLAVIKNLLAGKQPVNKLEDKNLPASLNIRSTRSINEKWIMIQKNTFTNWINEQLKGEEEKIRDLRIDLADGVKLVKLINMLQSPSPKVAKRYFKNPINQHQCLENISMVLTAISNDGVRLVNIGEESPF